MLYWAPVNKINIQKVTYCRGKPTLIGWVEQVEEGRIRKLNENVGDEMRKRERKFERLWCLTIYDSVKIMDIDVT